MKKILALMFAATVTLTACDIDRFPIGSMPKEGVTSDPEEMLQYTLNGCYGQLKNWSDVMHRCGEYAGDNMMIRGTSSDAFYQFISYSRTPNNDRLQTFWDNSYKIIAQTSNIMKMIPEGANPTINNSLGECYFLRGMMYFYLCRAYGRPYYQDPNKKLGGLPIVNGTPENMFDISLPDRATVDETYHQAIGDLRKAEKMLSIDKGPAYPSKEATQALLSRIYLYMSGTYKNPNTVFADSAVYYANQVITSDKYQLLDRENFMKYNTKRPEENKESIFVVKRLASEFSGYDHYYGVGGMYAVIGEMGWGEMYASGKYLALLDETGRNDWANKKIVDARAAFIEPQYTGNAVKDGKNLGYKQRVFRVIVDTKNKDGVHTSYNYAQDTINYNKTTGELIYEADGKSLKCWMYVTVDKITTKKEYIITPINQEQGVYSVNYPDGKTYQGVIDYNMSLNRVYPMFYITKCSREGEESHLHSPIISRLSEIYLNRAEAYAKLGDYGKAATDLNKIRERSLPGKGYAALDATNAALRIDKERQLELAYQAERSYDVYRNGDALERKYPGPHDAMEAVQPTDFRVVFFIPQNAINAYPGTLTQNPTSN